MNQSTQPLKAKVALITGSARRIGAEIARTLHTAGACVVIHYSTSVTAAEDLISELNAIRPGSCLGYQAELGSVESLRNMISEVILLTGGLDILVNNASSFHPTPMGSITEKDWEQLFDSNLKGPLFLSQAAAPYLKASKGCIINMVDIHAQRPLAKHSVYCAAKAGLVMLTQSLAQELGPEVRVNAVAPGIIIWPETDQNKATQQDLISRTALKREGMPVEIAQTVLFLAQSATYITGQVIAVDGGRTLNQ
ncbi:pteridine reductase [Leucothrix mucor]|uniref:pteridine reductase n=1 Tax=Leucothrix mucor TaxID=45248 RepID=UPI0003B51A4B|nr:pteridine reductase [Leucothrix mucor]